MDNIQLGPIITKSWKRKRVVIPACLVHEIRETYPEVNGVYVGFKPSYEL